MITTPTEVERLVKRLREVVPALVVSVDAPSRPSASWFVDVRVDDREFAIEYRPGLGFGLSSVPTEGMSEGPDEFLPDVEALATRLASLVRSKSRTEPQRVRLLQELRERVDLSQSELATRLGVKQPTVSKIERREDLNLSTLRRYVRALGGELRITARFANESVEINLPDAALSLADR